MINLSTYSSVATDAHMVSTRLARGRTLGGARFIHPTVRPYEHEYHVLRVLVRVKLHLLNPLSLSPFIPPQDALPRFSANAKLQNFFEIRAEREKYFFFSFLKRLKAIDLKTGRIRHIQRAKSSVGVT